MVTYVYTLALKSSSCRAWCRRSSVIQSGNDRHCKKIDKYSQLEYCLDNRRSLIHFLDGPFESIAPSSNRPGSWTVSSSRSSDSWSANDTRPDHSDSRSKRRSVEWSWTCHSPDNWLSACRSAHNRQSNWICIRIAIAHFDCSLWSRFWTMLSNCSDHSHWSDSFRRPAVHSTNGRCSGRLADWDSRSNIHSYNRIYRWNQRSVDKVQLWIHSPD